MNAGHIPSLLLYLRGGSWHLEPRDHNGRLTSETLDVGVSWGKKRSASWCHETYSHTYIYILTVRQVLILRTYVGTNLPDQDVRFTHRLEQHRHSKCMVFSMWDTKAHIERDTTNIEQSLQLHIEHVEG